MASTSSSSSSSAREFEVEKEIKRQEVAIDELNCLSSSRRVYHINGNLFFLTTAEKAKKNAQKQLDYQNLKSSRFVRRHNCGAFVVA
ncbi:hypothetical protein EUTSA_v10011900mg [Eutrema salsugineum]|uniref:Uncharacterized protein n=1 Tax=Eutrema salsugineum TaxID=72664 RepID=V4KKX8_EUTSA|nr:hypothetical protein EUTSA_v10011900mg [Eutrema salsugineum]